MGAWNLHLALGEEPVEFFLMLSSISAVFGLPGQSNYSAANNFLDKLVLQRRLQGLAAQSVELGVMGRYAGMSREGGAVLNVLESQGWRPLSLGQVLAKVERILLEDGTVRMSLNTNRQKVKNLMRRPESTLFFMDPANPYRTLEIRATCEIASDPDHVLAGRVGGKYGADLRQMDKPGEERVAVTFTPVKVNTYG